MNQSNTRLQRAATAPAFNEQWQAQVFVLACHLHEAGYFTWREWTDTFAAISAEAGANQHVDDGSRYYHCWLGALERMTVQKNLASAAELITRKDAWLSDYISIPHGQPVSFRPDKE